MLVVVIGLSAVVTLLIVGFPEIDASVMLGDP
jgi:hypothetical protein